ncbi:MAG: 3-dehydroquinate synthase [Myxococcales bacterium]|nr:3-dehydroquinate synthase [Myxococcales bacterium]|tara:strand:+ start:446 stop:1633 length:1188 start_codon:yes stop_codon:yes gene_type:complete
MGTKDTTAAIVRQEFSVPFSYSVAFTEALFSVDNPLLRDTVRESDETKRHRMAAVIDSGVADAWPDLAIQISRYALAHGQNIELVGEPIIVPGGEGCKNTNEFVDQLRGIFAERGLDRHSFVLAIGGGAVLDMAGYAAATTHRGVRLLRVPTTVLAQNDAGVGVKNGINAFNSKNFLGTFCPPFAVLNDIDFIETLEVRDKRAGMAEAVKVALIRDADFFRWLQANGTELGRFQRDQMAYMIKRCAELHLNHIATSGDPFEYGSARPLDFGHWAAHKLEVLTEHQLRHGEAVAIGIALDTAYSVETGLLNPSDFEAVCSVFDELGLATDHELLREIDRNGQMVIINGLEEFRQHLGGELTVTMLADIGVGVEVNEVDLDALRRSVQRLSGRSRAA